MQWVMTITLNYQVVERNTMERDANQVSIPSVGIEKDLSQEIANIVLKRLSQSNRGGSPTTTRANVSYEKLCKGLLTIPYS